jgi:hypothetical protein
MKCATKCFGGGLVSDFLNQLELLFTTACKPLIFCLAAVVGGTFYFAKTIYEREISTLKTERDGLRTENTDLKTRLKAAAPPAVAEDDGPLIWFSNVSMEGGPLSGRNVFSLTFPGANKSTDPIKLKSASLVSGIDGTALQLEILAGSEIVPLSSIGHIPAGAPIRLIAKFGEPDPNAPGKILGLEPKVFVERWRKFTFVADDEKRSYKFPYSEAFMATFLAGIVGPRVTKIDAK